MTDDRSLERAARSWIEAGPTQAPDRAVEAALLRIESTTQERDLRIPWRLPKMTTPARVAAAAVIGVLAVGSAMFVLGPRGQPAIGGPSPSRATPSPSSSGPTLESYRAARDAICTPLTQQLIVLNDAGGKLHPETKPADIPAATANLEQVVAIGESEVASLAALTAPDSLAADHAADVTHHRDSLAVLKESVAKLREGKGAEAMAIADAITPLSSVEEAFEAKYTLAGCP